MKNLPEWLKLLKGSLADDDNDEEFELLLAEPIGFDPATYDGMSSRRFGEVLGSIPRRKKGKLLINTLGGRIDEGTSMYNMIRARGNMDTVVIGYAASMGAIVAQAGAKRYMCKGTTMMVHNPLGGLPNGYGDADDAETLAKTLRTLKIGLVDIMHERTGMGKKKISELMDATTFMSADEAKELGFCDEVISDGPTYNSLDIVSRQEQFTKSYRQFASAPKCAVGDDGGAPEQAQKPKSMKALTAALHKLGLVSSADLTDETAIMNEVNAKFAPINSAAGEVAGLKTEIQNHKAALKVRVENRVQKAIDDKKIKAERKDSLVALGLQNETNLDFLDDIAVAQAPAAQQPNNRRAAPPLAKANIADSQSTEEQLIALKDEMSDCKDPIELAKLANKARALRRGNEVYFGRATFTPATQAAAQAAAK